MKISELKPKQPNVSLTATVKKIGELKEFDKGDKKLRLVKATIRDDSGEIELTLWNEDIDKVKEGDVIKIDSGYVKEYKGEKQLTIGRMGELEVLEQGDEDDEGQEKEEDNEPEVEKVN